MQVGEMMSRAVHTCCATDTLSTAARIMWDHDCGSVPVVDPHERIVGMITDRDICMASYTQGRSPHTIAVGSVMAKQLCVCRAHDDVSSVIELMGAHQVRRVVVVDSQRRVVGVVSLADLAQAAQRRLRGHTPVSPQQLSKALAAVTRKRGTVEPLPATFELPKPRRPLRHAVRLGTPALSPACRAG